MVSHLFPARLKFAGQIAVRASIVANTKKGKMVMHIITWMAVLLSLGWLCYTLIIRSKMLMQRNYIKQLEADVAELRKKVMGVG